MVQQKKKQQEKRPKTILLLGSVLFIIAQIVIAVFAYPYLPDEIVTHWNGQQMPDSTMPRIWGIFMIPLISFGILSVFVLFPKIDPLKENFSHFKKVYNLFLLTIVGFLTYLHFLILLWNAGTTFNITQALLPGLSVLLIVTGVFIAHARPNWFFGVRTPWTLSSTHVWEKTHAIARYFFILWGLILLVGLLETEILTYLIAIPAVLFALFVFIYSALLYRSEKKG